MDLDLPQTPALSIFTPDILFRFGRVGALQILAVPLDFFAGAERDVSKMVCFGKPTGVRKIASGWSAGFASVNPFRSVSARGIAS